MVSREVGGETVVAQDEPGAARSRTAPDISSRPTGKQCGGGKPAREPFGARAVRMGFVSWEQVEKALAVQKKLRERGVDKLIGMIMIEMEMLDTTQLLSVLKTYELEQETSGKRQVK